MATKELISTVTVGAGGAASIDFTSIPQDGTDLLVIFSTRSSYAAAYGLYPYVRVNGNSTSSYEHRNLRGDGVTAGSSWNSSDNRITLYAGIPGSTATSNTFGNNMLRIMNYATTGVKIFSGDGVGENNAANADIAIIHGELSTTTAITSLSIFDPGGNFTQYSTASLYKITKGSGGASVS